ncbi:Eco57I restriction-modification methylase domain-containing protein [Adlercreutzia sp. ZJ473]|uniref:Eco57I restriction-modification methylase domain-containing protein n=1 Tax=Adlercreutzia sp. ZJ473 TaxID=2722822 RepID=UPI0015565D86|nr:methyltransferase [Adlercreutzia sp. ZJ473]
MASVLQQAAQTRTHVIQATSDEKRNALAQHLTPAETAKLAVSMFSELGSDQAFIRCLDLGAGTGMLSIALYDRYDGRIEQLDAVEADPVLATIFEAEMASVGVPHELTQGDALIATPDAAYDRVILNPPYKKMAANDPRQDALPCKSANLYAAFIAVGLSRLADNGELVAIVPRSWTNGGYFEPFRRYALSSYSLDAIHVYGSRTEVFSDTKVLQETMLVKFSKRKQVEEIEVSQSMGKSDGVTRTRYSSQDLIDPFGLVVRITPQDGSKLEETVCSLGLCPSTGKVVDFRNRERIFEEKPEGNDVYPMIYAGNFPKGVLEHPLRMGKPQWYKAEAGNVKALKQLIKPGPYVVVKRFSAKEEKRRVVARPLVLCTEAAIENHLNFIHAGTPRGVVPLRSVELAQGISLWLNSTYLDRWFRGVSGSTQVNARDIKAMPCPQLNDLERIGPRWRIGMEQGEIDEICKTFI